jgi:enterochelin esterase-like enzyme
MFDRTSHRVRHIALLGFALSVAFFGAVQAVPSAGKSHAKSLATSSFGRPPRCAEGVAPTDVCQSELPHAALNDLKAGAGYGRLTYRSSGEYLDILFKTKQKAFSLGPAPLVCCDLQMYLDPVGPDLWAARIRVPRLDRAVLDLGVLNSGKMVGLMSTGFHPVTYVGAHADHPALKPARFAQPLKEITFKSAALGESRKVHVFTGKLCTTTAPPCRILYFADGVLFEPFLYNAPIAQRQMLDRWIIVGLDGPVNKTVDHNRRNAELLLDEGKPDFTAFETFLVKEVMPRIEGSAYGSIPREIGGSSDGGSWAINMALRHPGLFCDVLAFSSGKWTSPHDVGDASLDQTVFWMGSGTVDDFYAEDIRYAAAVKKLGFKVHQQYFTGGHSPTTWNALFWWALAGQEATTEKCKAS